MKTLLLQILHYLWSRKENIYSLYLEIKKNKNIKIDWKINLNEILEYLKIIKKSWLIIDEVDEEKVYFWNIWWIKENKYKKLIQYTQSSRACVIYAVCRTFTYNTGIVLSKDEVEAVKMYAYQKWWWADKKGMSFRDWLRALAWWSKENKWISIRYDRVKYGSLQYEERKAKWYSCILWWQITNKYITDFKTDWVINANYNWNEVKRYWHCFSEEEKFTDNYPSRFKYNRYTNKMFGKFVNKWYMYSYCCFIFLEEEIKVKEEVKQLWEYRRLAWKSVINNPNNLIEAIRNWEPDEAVACIEIIVNRKNKKQ